MDINVQLFTGSCTTPAELNLQAIAGKLKKILKKTNIVNAIIGWYPSPAPDKASPRHNNTDLSEIISLLKNNGTDIYLWMPVFSELEALAGFRPIIGHDGKPLEINYNMGTGENFVFYCPANNENIEKIIETYEKNYNKEIYDGVFLDKIRFPSFISGLSSVLGCFCNYCRSKYDLPEISELHTPDSMNPFGINSYSALRYDVNGAFKKLFDYKCDAVFNSLECLCAYFRGRSLKIGLDLFSPFLAYFVGQDYHRLLYLADFVKPMFYSITNAPAGLPFEINMYTAAFDDNADNAEKRKRSFLNCTGYGNGFINSEITGIRKIIDENKLKTKLYAGIELNYNESIAPVTEGYIRESVAKTKGADGIVTSWDLNTTPDSHIDCLLDTVGDLL